MEGLKLNINIENRLAMLNRLLEHGDYDSLVRESATLLEEILRKVILRIMPELGLDARRSINEFEMKIGKNTRGMNQFSLGELAALYNATKFMKLLQSHLGIDLSLLMAFDLHSVVNIRNALVHSNKDGYHVNYHEAKLIYDYTLNWLAYLGYAEIENSTFKKSIGRETPHDNSYKETKKVEQTNVHNEKRKEASIYSASYGNENQRLAIQAQNALQIDSDAFDIAYKILGQNDRGRKYFGLDLGCASGHVTRSRFDMNYFSKVLGIDYNEEKITEAKKNETDNLKYLTMDLEHSSFLDTLFNTMQKNGMEYIDIAFSALTVHHLKDPRKLLRILRKLMKKGSVVILRGSDDGSKIAYPDSGIMNRIINMTLAVEGVSDRLNGRKLYTYLLDSGFSKIQMLYATKDTVGMNFDERNNLFLESFSYRKDYFKKRLETDPKDLRFQDEYNEICNLINELEELFCKNDFYYAETDYVAIAQL